MTVEADITRKLGIRFIDARALASEAKLARGVTGYATREQVPMLIAKAVQLFQAKSEDEQDEMRRLNEDLESVKDSQHSRSKRLDDDSGSLHTVDSSASFFSMRRNNDSGFFRKVVSMGTMRNKVNLVSSTKGGGPMKNATFANNTAGGLFLSAPAHENPLLKKVSSTGIISRNVTRKNSPRTVVLMENHKCSLLSSSGDAKRNRGARVDRLGAILDIPVPVKPSSSPY